MTYFNVDPKPKDFIHPNGTKAIKHVRVSPLGASAASLPLLQARALCDDPVLEWFEGDGFGDVTYDTTD